jgi:3-isopropylmalate/(R)-2-methylmalate dehydratase large subunit
MNDDKVPAGKYASKVLPTEILKDVKVGSRTLLASPIIALTAAVTGV